MMVFNTLLQDAEVVLCISLSYYLKESILKGVILNATNLKRHDFSGLAGSSEGGKKTSVFLDPMQGQNLSLSMNME